MTPTTWLATGALAELSRAARRVIVDRATSGDNDTARSVASIIARVRRDGDAALKAFAREFEGVALNSLEVPRTQWEVARKRIDDGVRTALEQAAERIADVHRAFVPTAVSFTTRDGVVITRRADALERAGVYAPGGRAAYPSSLLMGAVTARVAGVREIIVCSPPATAAVPSDIVLAAAAIAGAHRVFAVGGAGAIAAMAYGTETVPRVDRIAGPGNAFVAEAKRQVAADVAIDSPAGPSELLVIADEDSDPELVAREVLAQAEHDPHAAIVVLCLSKRWSGMCARAIDAQLADEPRRDIIADALASRGALLVTRDLDEALTFANEYAPEHLLLTVRSTDELTRRVRNAGTVFLGNAASVSFGDYMTGANHVLPTGGCAHTYSGLSTQDFFRWTTFQRIDRAAALKLASHTAILADAEGLPAHARAARHWSSE